MNRRDFLTGLFGAAVVATLPITKALSLPTHQAFIDAVLEVQSQAWMNFLAYGCAAIESIEDFPYVRSVPLNEIYTTPDKFQIIKMSNNGLLNRDEA